MSIYMSSTVPRCNLKPSKAYKLDCLTQHYHNYKLCYEAIFHLFNLIIQVSKRNILDSMLLSHYYPLPKNTEFVRTPEESGQNSKIEYVARVTLELRTFWVS